MTPKSISVIINTYNRRQSLAITLRSLAWLDYPHFEVIVVNGPSADDTEDFLNAFSGNMKVGSCENRNLSESRNVGVQMASGEIVAFIDDDTYPDPGWLNAINNTYDLPEIGAAGGPVVGHTGYDFQAWYSLADRYGDAWTDFPPAINPTLYLAAPQSQHLIYTMGRTVHFGEIFSSRSEDLTKSSSTTSKRPTCVAASPTRDTSFGRSMRDSCTKISSERIREDNKVVKDWYQVLRQVLLWDGAWPAVGLFR